MQREGGGVQGCRLCVIKNCHTLAEASVAVTRNEILQNDVIALFIAPHKSCQCRFAASTLVSLRIRHVRWGGESVEEGILFFTLAKAHNLFYVVSLPFVALFTAAIYLASSVAARTHTLHLQLQTQLYTLMCVALAASKWFHNLQNKQVHKCASNCQSPLCLDGTNKHVKVCVGVTVPVWVCVCVCLLKAEVKMIAMFYDPLLTNCCINSERQRMWEEAAMCLANKPVEAAFLVAYFCAQLQILHAYLIA